MKKRPKTDESTLLEAKKDLAERRRILRKVNVQKLKQFLSDFAKNSKEGSGWMDKRSGNSIVILFTITGNRTFHTLKQMTCLRGGG